MARLNTYLKKNDNVMVIAGKEKGKSGRILMLMTDKGRALVEKLNTVKHHQKPTATNRQGGIVEKESGIHLSNLMLICSKCNKPVRISRKVVDGKKVRVCKKCGDTIAQVSK
ncbi:MAG: 50S ribosomal protein L24 [bacterium]